MIAKLFNTIFALKPLLMSSIESCNNSQYLYSFFPNSPANNRFLIKYSKEAEIILFEFNESCSFFIF